MGGDLFNVAIATIFAREFLEGSLIIGNYRTVILKNDNMTEENKKVYLKAVTMSALFATLVAFLVVLAVAIPLGVLSKDLDEKAADIIEGISKVVASIAILQLSLKIPVWLGVYEKVPLLPWKKQKKKKTEDGGEVDFELLSMKEIRFNVSWNIWREVAECGVFLIPFFLGTGAEAIPLSAVAGILISLVIGMGIYTANQKLQSKVILAIFMAGLTGFLAVGLFVGGCHEFEEVWGETDVVYKIHGEFWNHKKFPMVLVKPFGYSAKRTVLQITCFWIFTGLGVALHALKWRNTANARKNRTDEGKVLASDDSSEDVKDVEAEAHETSSDEDNAATQAKSAETRGE